MKTNFLNLSKRAVRLITVLSTIYASSLYSQAPEKMSYQAVIRDAANELLINQNITMKISILQGSMNGSAVYIETHAQNTNDNGLISLEIGTGSAVIGTFSSIEWGNGPFFIKTEADPTGGTNYTISGTSQLLSVPYALHAKTADNGLPSGGSEGQILTLCDGQAIWTDNGECPTNIISWPTGYVHCNPSNPTQVVDVTNPVTGAIWMDRNLGANRAAISSTDEEAYGSLFQWGRGADGHQCVHRYAGDGVITSGITATLSSSDTPQHSNFITINGSPNDWRLIQNNDLWQGVNGVNNPCPNGYRLPTETELNNERLSWGQAPISSTNNLEGALASPLKLPLPGRRYNSGGTFNAIGSFGYYWSSTVSGANSRIIVITSSNAAMANLSRANGRSVRCIKD